MQNMNTKPSSNTSSIAESSGARRATDDSAEISSIPNPEASAKTPKRRFTSKYKLSIIQQADACQSAGEVGALLRREGLYSSSLSTWRRLHREGALGSLKTKQRGPKAHPAAVEKREISRLEKRVAKLEHELQKAHTIIDVQKKLSLILSNLPEQEES